MDKEHILGEIRRTSKDGKVLGQTRFETETGIKQHQWRGKFWANWGDAVIEAGYKPNEWTEAHDVSLVLQLLANLTRRKKKFPTKAEMQLERGTNPAFPDPKSIYRIGGKASLIIRLKEFCQTNSEYNDIMGLLSESVPISVERELAIEMPPKSSGYVYLVKAQNAYKIGFTRAPYRRAAEIVNQSAYGAELIHLIPTDDPEGIEKYWHTRFDEKRIAGQNKQSGEWFQLTKDDLKAFQRRKSFM